MRFYDFMTLVWAVFWAVPTGVMTVALAGTTRDGYTLGAIATAAMAVCVVFWRMYKDPG